MYVFVVAAVVETWKTDTKFCKVVLKHVIVCKLCWDTEQGFTTALLQIPCWIQKWKTSENWSTHAEVMHKCKEAV